MCKGENGERSTHPQNLKMKEAPIAEPCAVALHAVELGEKALSKPFKNNKVLVIGAGAIGLLCGLILSKIKNCKDIVIVDPNDKRLKEFKSNYTSVVDNIDEIQIRLKELDQQILEIEEKDRAERTYDGMPNVDKDVRKLGIGGVSIKDPNIYEH